MSAAVEPFLRETPTLTLGCLTGFLLGTQARLTRFLLGELAGTGFGLRLLLTLALFLGLARGLGLQPAALGGEPLLLGSPLLPGGLFQGKLLGALTLEALALGALLGFPPTPGLPLFFRNLGAALGLSELTAHQVAAVVIDGSAAVLLAHLALRLHRRRRGSILRLGTAAGREHEEEDDRCVLVHGSPFTFGKRAAPDLRELTLKGGYAQRARRAAAQCAHQQRCIENSYGRRFQAAGPMVKKCSGIFIARNSTLDSDTCVDDEDRSAEMHRERKEQDEFHVQ